MEGADEEVKNEGAGREIEGAAPMQWAPVEHADEMVKEGPWSLKAVERTAEVVEPIERVTR